MTIEGVLIFNIVLVSIILVALIILGVLIAKYEMKRREQVAKLTARAERFRKELLIAQADNQCLVHTIEELKAKRAVEIKNENRQEF